MTKTRSLVARVPKELGGPSLPPPDFTAVFVDLHLNSEDGAFVAVLGPHLVWALSFGWQHLCPLAT